MNDLNRNYHKISLAADSLSEEEKYKIYRKCKTHTIVPIIFNLFPGFGVGSFVQGDNLGGTIGLSAEFFALLCLLSHSADAREAGAGIWALGMVFGIFRPLFYSQEHNDKIKLALGFSNTDMFSFAPTIIYAPDRSIAPGLTFTFNL